MKEKKTKYLRGPSVFEFIVNNLGPFEKPFHKLGLHVSSDFQTLETIRALDLRSRAFISFLVFGNPDETLAHVHEILLVLLIPGTGNGERGTGVWELMYSGNPLENSK